MLVIQQLIIFVLLLTCIIGSTFFLFWLFFKKDSPEYNKVTDTVLPEALEV